MITLNEDEIPTGALRLHRYHPFVLSAQGTYVHRARSGYVYDDGKVSLQFWCGQYGRVPGARPVDKPEAPVCGTCEGRFLGQNPEAPDLIFAPRSVFNIHLTWCPARNKRLWVAPKSNWRLGQCLLCGFQGRVNSCGDVFYDQKLEAHRPQVTRALINCPEHGWKHLYGRQGTMHSGDPLVVCTSHRCEFEMAIPEGVNLG